MKELSRAFLLDSLSESTLSTFYAIIIEEIKDTELLKEFFSTIENFSIKSLFKLVREQSLAQHFSVKQVQQSFKDQYIAFMKKSRQFFIVMYNSIRMLECSSEAEKVKIWKKWQRSVREEQRKREKERKKQRTREFPRNIRNALDLKKWEIERSRDRMREGIKRYCFKNWDLPLMECGNCDTTLFYKPTVKVVELKGVYCPKCGRLVLQKSAKISCRRCGKTVNRDSIPQDKKGILCPNCEGKILLLFT